MSLRVGLINYVNIFPVTHYLEEEHAWTLVGGAPCEVNRMLAEGALDTSPISSIEYARHQDEYLLLPDFSISSRGSVRSVMLFSRLPLERLEGEAIGICRATATSRVLLRILLEDYVGVIPRYEEDATLGEVRRGAYPAVLLIGDEALAFRSAARREPDLAAYVEHDLGQMWLDWTGLPMVFAVWAMRRDAPSAAEGGRLVEALRTSRERGLALPPDLLERAEARTGMSHDDLRAYYRGLHFTLGPDEERALLTFYRHAAGKGLCPPCDRRAVAAPALPAGNV